MLAFLSFLVSAAVAALFTVTILTALSFLPRLTVLLGLLLGDCADFLGPFRDG